ASRVCKTLPVGKPKWPLKTVSFSAGNNRLRFFSICAHYPDFFAVAACKRDPGSVRGSGRPSSTLAKPERRTAQDGDGPDAGHIVFRIRTTRKQCGSLRKPRKPGYPGAS